ncbi:MAG: M23 family metallopeptidase [Candidatus Andersenbacteria bacterium]|nr:M23 family metallopeptidase [Candidatus Andersenbacteria bacterium]
MGEDQVRRMSRSLRAGAVLLECLEPRLCLSHLDTLEFLWPTGGNQIDTYPGHVVPSPEDPDGLNAIDINQDPGKGGGSDRGRPVLAASAGQVQWISSVVADDTCDLDGGYGNAIRIAHGNGVETLYTHLIAPPTLQVGDRVTTGQPLGQVGCTGRATDFHLHFELREVHNGVSYVDIARHGPRFAKGILEPVNDDLMVDGRLQARAGERVPVRLKGFDWNERVLLYLKKSGQTIAQSVQIIRTDDLRSDEGSQIVQFPLPRDLALGHYGLHAQEQNTPASNVQVQWLSRSIPLLINVEGVTAGQDKTQIWERGKWHPIGNAVHETASIQLERDGNILISAFQFGRRTFQGFLQLLGFNGEILPLERTAAARDGVVLAYRDAVPGQYLVDVSYDIPLPPPGLVSWTQSPEVPSDPARNTPPPRVFHDSAGSVFPAARLVALDATNKGDDAGRISPRDDNGSRQRSGGMMTRP